MRTFKTKLFARFAEKERISNVTLLRAVEEALRKPDADLGGGLIKQRIARPNEGKSGGYRSILVFRSGDRAIFVHGFAKNDRENITASELRELKSVAALYLKQSMSDLEYMTSIGQLWEVVSDEDESSVQK